MALETPLCVGHEAAVKRLRSSEGSAFSLKNETRYCLTGGGEATYPSLMVFPSSWVALLVVVNLFLQVWDGCATYYGLAQGVQEGNPLLRSCMEYWGVGVTLVGAKSAACVFLVYLHEVASLSVSQWGLILAAGSYVVGSFLPWSLVFLR